MILKQKISDELFTHDIKITTSIIVKLSKINTELNSKFTAEIKKFKTRDADYAFEV